VTVVCVPNVSEGRDGDRIEQLEAALREGGGRVLDVHSDADHNRSVFTAAAPAERVPDAMAALAAAASYIDLRRHVGAHPRLGALDVCPVVAYRVNLSRAAEIARATASAIVAAAGVPVYLYGAAARRTETRELPSLRRGGLEGLIRRAAAGLTPDLGPASIDPRRGVVCVGARGPLIAFNVWLEADAAGGRRVAAAVRSSGGGLPGVRALGLQLPRAGLTQVSMNLVEPHTTGIDRAFDAVAAAAEAEGAKVVATEIVGLVPDRYAPDRSGRAARLLVKPSRSLESALDR
jgi:glutamate formiminotransferase